MGHGFHADPPVPDLRWRGSESGATAVEYAIMVGAIAAAVILAVAALGLTTEGLISDLLARWP
jgi:Flp pilus assembly pilin Flp